LNDNSGGPVGTLEEGSRNQQDEFAAGVGLKEFSVIEEFYDN